VTIREKNITGLIELIEDLEKRIEKHEEVINIELQDSWTNPDDEEVVNQYMVTIKSYPKDENAFTYKIAVFIFSELKGE